MKASIILILVHLFISISYASNSNKNGYWWGEKPPIEKTEEEKIEPPPPLPPFEEMMKWHPKKMKKMEEVYRDHAVYTRDPEHVKNYWTVVDVARRQARGFTAVTGYVMMNNPEMNAKTQNPITNAGRTAKRQIHDNEIQKRLLDSRKDFALVMFSQPNCPYCETQRSTLKYFTGKYYWPVKEIDITKRPDLAAKYNVNITPVTILIAKNKEDWMPISVGADSVPNVADNTYRAIRLMNDEIDPEMFYTPEYMEGGFFDPNKAQGE